jgi:uncharacterized protein with HEPN domain
MSRDPGFLLDMLDMARLLDEFRQKADRTTFERDKFTQLAVIKAIEIIGEAARRISFEFRSLHPEIPWQEIVGMRSQLVHNYDKVDLNEVWRVIEHDIPILIAQIEPLVPPDSPDED